MSRYVDCVLKPLFRHSHATYHQDHVNEITPSNFMERNFAIIVSIEI
jgi:hypothetical protein